MDQQQTGECLVPYAKVCSKHFSAEHMEQIDTLVTLKEGTCPILENIERHLCRLCAKAQREQYADSLDDLRRTTELALLVDLCLGSKVPHSSRLPDGVCGDCTETLNHSMDFVRRCQEAQLQLQAVYEDLSDYEIKSETEDSPAEFTEGGQREKSPEDVDGKSDISVKTDPEEAAEWRTFDNAYSASIESEGQESCNDEKVHELEEGDSDFQCTNRKSCSDDDTKPSPMSVRKRRRTSDNVRDSEKLFPEERKAKKIPRQTPSHSKQICQICGKVLSSSATFNVHMMTHTQQKDIVCNICDRRFYVKQQLKIHIESIHEKKDFICSVCGLKCRWRKSLRRHMLLHDDNPYKHKCTYCDKSFARPNQLRYHVMKHTGDRVYCNICGADYRFNYMLTQHKIRKHGIVVEGVQLYKQSQRKKKEPRVPDADTKPRVRAQRNNRLRQQQPLPEPAIPPPTITELHQVPQLPSPITTVSCFESPKSQATHFPPSANLTQLGYTEGELGMTVMQIKSDWSEYTRTE